VNLTSVLKVIGLLYNDGNGSLSIWPATVFGLVSGALAGLLNGLIITRLRINTVITTLGSLTVIRGLAFALTGAESARLEVESFKFIGRGALAGVPVPLLIMLAVYVMLFFVLYATDFGRRIYAVGGNAEAARLAGIAVRDMLVWVYVICGLLAALGGVLLAAQLAASFPKAADGLELTVIAAVILGGCSLSGGKGTIVGTLLGVLILRTLDNGLVLANVSSYYQEVARGAVLLLAVAFDQLRKREE
jgi:ribose transport system permease protein